MPFLFIFLILFSQCGYGRNTRDRKVYLFNYKPVLQKYNYNEFQKAFYSRDFNTVIRMYQNGVKYTYGELLTGWAYHELKKYRQAIKYYYAALKKLSLISGFIYYLIGDAYHENRNLSDSYQNFLKVDTGSTYYYKARKRAYEYMINLRLFSKILSTQDKLNLQISRYFKAEAALSLRNKKLFIKHFSVFLKNPIKKLYKKSVLLWLRAGLPYIDDFSNYQIAYLAYRSNMIGLAINSINKIKNTNNKTKNLKASILLRKGYSTEIKKLYMDIFNSSGELKQKAEYMILRCLSFEGKKKEYVQGMRKIAFTEKHKYRLNALKTVFAYSVKNKKPDYNILKILAKTDFHNPKYIYYIAKINKYNNSQILRVAKYILHYNKNKKFRAFLNNLVAEIYFRKGKLFRAKKYYLESAVCSSNFYSNLSYIKLKDMGYSLKKLNNKIKKFLISQKSNLNGKLQHIITAMKNAPEYKSDKADLFIKIGDRRRAWLASMMYLKNKGIKNLLSVIKYFADKKCLPSVCEYALHLKSYLYKNGLSNNLYTDIADLMFPDAFNYLFRHNNGRNLLKAVVMGESFFHEFAHSRAGAIGFTQKMPDTARWLAKNKKLKIHEIFNAKLNIKLGAKFIKWLLKKFKNKIDALGSYNAGPGRFRRYIRRYKKRSISDAHFVEKIPLDETRNYIIKVLNAYVFLLVNGK